MNLYLMRHGIAADPDGNTPDSQRPLTEKGRKKLEKIAGNFEKLDLTFDLILTSPYLRARQTADVVAAALDLQPWLVKESQNISPVGDVEKLVDEINALESMNDLLIVGHEPFLSQMIGMLLAGDANLNIEVRKASLCKLSIRELTYRRCAALEWFMTPTQLAAF